MPFSYIEIERRLFKIGYRIIRQNGSHVLFGNGKIIFPVPKHGGKEISIGVEKKILKNIGFKLNEFKGIK